ncbi:hypothetical protein PC120_g22068 [Phytophthora cactorum]|nr:hypothetical protein PC120_g22068 [Phytophthora cactorum]
MGDSRQKSRFVFPRCIRIQLDHLTKSQVSDVPSPRCPQESASSETSSADSSSETLPDADHGTSTSLAVSKATSKVLRSHSRVNPSLITPLRRKCKAESTAEPSSGLARKEQRKPSPPDVIVEMMHLSILSTLRLVFKDKMESLSLVTAGPTTVVDTKKHSPCPLAAAIGGKKWNLRFAMEQVLNGTFKFTKGCRA